MDIDNQGASHGERGHPNVKEAFRPQDRWNNRSWSGSGGGRARHRLIARAWKGSSLGLFSRTQVV